MRDNKLKLKCKKKEIFILKIQLIRYGSTEPKPSQSIFVSTINEPKSLDEFDINIVDLRSEKLWQSNSNKLLIINGLNHLKDIRNMIINSKKATTVALFPQNTIAQYDYDPYDRKFRRSIYLKQCNSAIENTLNALLTVSMPILFENTTTTINNQDYEAAFYFNIPSNNNNVTLSLSNSSEKPTTIQFKDRVIITTLNINCGDELHLNSFLEKCNLINAKDEFPKWLFDYHILDDQQQQQIIEEQHLTIEDAKSKINNAEDQLEDNLEYKSILFTNGDDLANRCMHILEKILNIDLSTFVDERKEDFFVDIGDDLAFIGEIKGVTSNVKSEHISQLEVHYQTKVEENYTNDILKTVKALLLINPFRTTPITERKPVHENQIKLSERNESLIIETKTLLYIYEQFVCGKLNSYRCLDMFSQCKGLLTQEIVDCYCNGGS